MRDFVRRILRLGIEVHALTPPGEFSDELANDGLVWHRLRMRRGRRGLWTAPWSLADILGAARGLRPDLVMNVTALPVLVGSVAAALTREAAVVNVLPGLGHLFATPQRGTRAERWLVRSGFRWVASRPHTALVFQLKADRDRIVTRTQPGRAHVAIIPGWGVDADRFDLERKETTPPLVVLIARMLWAKGISDFVEAARRHRSAGHPARFAIVGTPDPGNPGSISVEELDRWKGGESVEWWGWRSDIPELLSQASLLVLPTRYGEGVPRVLVEAAAAGLPAIASDVPGCRAIVEDQATGWLVPVGDVDSLERTIGRALADPVTRRTLGQAARRVVRDRFSADLVVDRYSEVFRSLGFATPWSQE
jgi:glycosyltransferase involved in cell wall biosynthesis